MLEKLKGYKTVIFFSLAFLVLVAQQFGFGDFVLSPEQNMVFEAAIILGGVFFRLISDSAAFKK